MSETPYLGKLNQANEILKELDLDAWLIFVRETALLTDPVTELLWDFAVIWPAAFVITADGQRIATAVRQDVPALTKSGLFTEVLPFQKVPEETLPHIIEGLDPKTIALNYSEGNVSADGLSYGLYLRLVRMFRETPYVDRFVSAERLIGLLRQRKLPSELILMKEAVQVADEIFYSFGSVLRPGMSETEMANVFLKEVRKRGIETSWDPGHCPNINAGPNTGRGHLGPQPHIVIEKGNILNVDFGVKLKGYCSDQQRMWYLLRDGEAEPPEEILKPFLVVKGAIRAGFEALKPGKQGWEVDAAARKFLTDAGYPETPSSLGHNVGHYCHDGGVATLSPRWPSYGERAYGIIEPNQVLTLEQGIWNEFGYYGLEEQVLVTETGAEWFWSPQEELMLV